MTQDPAPVPAEHAEAMVGCLYDAGLHVALAQLATKGIEPHTHRGVRHLLSLHVVKDGPSPRGLARDFVRLLTDRDLAHYGTLEEIDPESSRDTIRPAAAVLRPMLALLAEPAPETAPLTREALVAIGAPSHGAGLLPA